MKYRAMVRLLAFSALAFALPTNAETVADVFVDGDAERGKQLATQKGCVGCHGADGNSVVADNPKLAGQHAKYTVAQLEYFKSGERDNAIMQGQSASLSEQDMADIAVFYATQTVKVGAADEKHAFQGERIYRGGNKQSEVPACIGCHGARGEGNPGSTYPTLGGQHAKYVAAQLLAYRKEQRANPMAEIMQGVTHFLTDKEIEAVASYVEGLH